MPTAIVTGAGGLVGAESSAFLCEQGFDVIGIENDMRAVFFGPAASTARQTAYLTGTYDTFRAVDVDVRDADAVERLFSPQVELVIHAAAQPSHDWAAGDPVTDFTVNANGTLVVLEAARKHCPDATFVYTSTNKVYGDTPNSLPLEEHETRFDLPEGHAWHGGIDTTMTIDRSTHSLFGVSKTAADLAVQEYGRYFGLRTVCFRGGPLTGPRHAGAELHGFLSYLMRCTITGDEYTVFGHRAKQVRDNIHSADLVRAFLSFHAAPRVAAVYNIGGGRFSHCSMLEAIEICQRIAGRELEWTLAEEPRVGDHCWWISDLSEFQADYPDWAPEFGTEDILQEIHDQNVDAWTATPA